MGRKNKPHKQNRGPEREVSDKPDLLPTEIEGLSFGPSDSKGEIAVITKKGASAVDQDVGVSKARPVFVATVCHTCKAIPKEPTDTEPGNAAMTLGALLW
jgi:hypothetical protein